MTIIQRVEMAALLFVKSRQAIFVQVLSAQNVETEKLIRTREKLVILDQLMVMINARKIVSSWFNWTVGMV